MCPGDSNSSNPQTSITVTIAAGRSPALLAIISSVSNLSFLLPGLLLYCYRNHYSYLASLAHSLFWCTFWCTVLPITVVTSYDSFTSDCCRLQMSSARLRIVASKFICNQAAHQSPCLRIRFSAHDSSPGVPSGPATCYLLSKRAAFDLLAN